MDVRWLALWALLPMVAAGCGGARLRADAAPATDLVGPADVPSKADSAAPFRVLLFSRTAGFRHDAIPAAIGAVTEMGVANGYVAEATEDVAAFTSANLARFRVVAFLMTTGDVLDAAGQTAFEAWMTAGGNYVGVHSAADTEYDWPFYGDLVGAYFKQHPAIQQADVHVEVADHPATAPLPATWTRTDEWYDFQINPRPNVTVLATVNEASYTGGTMGADHPIVWSRPTPAGGRAIYTAMGHTIESYADPVFRAHLAGAIRWAARVTP